MSSEVLNEAAVAAAVPEKKAIPTSEERARKRAQALKFTDDGRPATLAALGDERRELTKNERIKIEKPGPQVWKDVVERYAAQGFDAIEEDDMERFKWIGIYQQRPKDGHFMLRMKVPGGFIDSKIARVVASLARDYGRGVADITTRQTFQMHWLTIDQVPDIMDRLETVGLGVKHGMFGACGDVTRNIVSSPINGVDPLDVIDPRPLVEESNKYFSSNPEYADLPRKYKVGLFGHRAAGQVEINDMSMYGVKRSDGTVGYGVAVGGGLSTEPFIAQDLNIFIKPEQAMEVFEAITRIYRDHGYRKNRKHARVKYLMADWGAAKYREEVEKVLGYKFVEAEPQPPVKGYEDKIGVHAQKQEGFSFVGVPVIGGRLRDHQIEEIANIADELGNGEIRLTVMQSFYLVNIRNENVPQVLARLEAIGLPVEASPIRKGIVACTGIEFCNLAVTETKNRAGHMVQLLDQGVKWNESEFFRINVNGCPNSCGQHWIADVGLQGCTKKIDGELVEHFDVFLGGALGTDARFNRRIKRVTAEEVPVAIQSLIGHYQGNRQGEETFAQWVERQSDEELEVLF
jgi:sulfite reductase beta subunit-like hemoprotein